MRFSFYYGVSDGAILGIGEARKIIELEIETGYVPAETVYDELKALLSRYKIYKLEKLLDAFAYRKYYCRY